MLDLRQEDSREVFARLVATADVLTAPINQVEDVVHDPQILHNNMIVATEHPVLGEVRVTGVPIRFYATPGSVRLHPPLLGEHTRTLLGELGYSAEEVQGLIRDGLVADNAEIEALRGARHT